MDKLRYFGRSLVGSLSPGRRACPCCGESRYEPVARKAVVTALVRCGNCRLLYRVPTDAPARAGAFYQDDYQSGMTTRLPSPQELQRLKDTSFAETAKDFSPRLAVLSGLGANPGAAVFDYGASWGYGTWQLARAGYRVVGYEISRPRAAYARTELGVDVRDDLDAVEGPFDVVFSSHVLEHVSDLGATLQRLRALVRPGGLFVAFTPNGCAQRAKAQPMSYRKSWGRLHPCLPDEAFYRHVFAGRPTLLASPPYDLSAMHAWERVGHVTLRLDGPELLLAAVC